MPSGMMTISAVPINRPAPKVVTFRRTLCMVYGQRTHHIQQPTTTYKNIGHLRKGENEGNGSRHITADEHRKREKYKPPKVVHNVFFIDFASSLHRGLYRPRASSYVPANASVYLDLAASGTKYKTS